MGSESLTTMVAGDSSFMIKTLYTFKLNGVSLNIDTTHVALLLVSVFILVMAVIARIKINKVDASDTPGMFQNVIEIIVEMLGTMVDKQPRLPVEIHLNHQRVRSGYPQRLCFLIHS